MNDTFATLVLLIMILLISTIVLFMVNINRDCTTNNQICRRLYTNTTDYLKCTTYDITYTIALIQPIKEVDKNDR